MYHTHRATCFTICSYGGAYTLCSDKALPLRRRYRQLHTCMRAGVRPPEARAFRCCLHRNIECTAVQKRWNLCALLSRATHDMYLKAVRSFVMVCALSGAASTCEYRRGKMVGAYGVEALLAAPVILERVSQIRCRIGDGEQQAKHTHTHNIPKQKATHASPNCRAKNMFRGVATVL